MMSLHSGAGAERGEHRQPAAHMCGWAAGHHLNACEICRFAAPTIGLLDQNLHFTDA